MSLAGAVTAAVTVTLAVATIPAMAMGRSAEQRALRCHARAARCGSLFVTVHGVGGPGPVAPAESPECPPGNAPATEDPETAALEEEEREKAVLECQALGRAERRPTASETNQGSIYTLDSEKKRITRLGPDNEILASIVTRSHRLRVVPGRYAVTLVSLPRLKELLRRGRGSWQLKRLVVSAGETRETTLTLSIK